MPSQHAILAPSAAKRWLACTPSARLEAQIPKPDTAYTIEGTIAHAIAENILRELTDNDVHSCPDYQDVWTAYQKGQFAQEYLNDLKGWEQKAKEQELDFADIFETVYEGYCRLVLEDYLEAWNQDKDAVLKIEQRLKLDEFIPEGFGSSDSVLIYNDCLNVKDLKFGKGVKVDSEQNPQMMCYALGALCSLGELYDIKRVKMDILQPRLKHYSSWEISAKELLTWAVKVLKPAAEKAFRGEGEYVAGEHCHFCAAAGRCKALKATAEVIVKAGEQPELMTDEELAVALVNLETVKGWIKAVEDTALSHMLAGGKVPGFKIVEGKSLRKIGDQAAAIKALADAGFIESDFMKPAELRTITDLEKLLRKQGFQQLLGPYVIKPQGKATIAPESDPRPAMGDAASDFDNVKL